MKPILIIAAFITMTFAAQAQKVDTIRGLAADTLIFTAVEKPPSFPGGDRAFNRYLAKTLKFPQGGVEGKVFAQFIIEKDGSLSRFRIVKSLSPAEDAEAIRVLKLSPAWNPGMQNGRKVRVYWTIPISFDAPDN